MPLTVTTADGVTVYTITPGSKSKCPLICQLLGSSACFVSEDVKQQMGRVHTALGAVQIITGFIFLSIGIIIQNLGSVFYFYYYYYSNTFPFTVALFLAAGIICILVDRFPSRCLIIFTVVMNLLSAVMAICAIVFYSMNLSGVYYYPYCNQASDNRYGHGYGYPLEKAWLNEQMEKCQKYQYLVKTMSGGLHILMIVICVLQICDTISMCVVSLKALCKKTKGDKMNVEDQEVHQPLMKEAISSPEC